MDTGIPSLHTVYHDSRQEPLAATHGNLVLEQRAHQGEANEAAADDVARAALNHAHAEHCDDKHLLLIAQDGSCNRWQARIVMHMTGRAPDTDPGSAVG